jgi:succinoglycan biosynthesis transport protein ExoP
MDGFDDQTGSNVRDYLRVLGRRRWVIILSVVVFLGLAIAYIVLTTPVYQGTANLLLQPELSSTLAQANNSNVVAIVDVATDIQLIGSGQVSAEVHETIPNAPKASVAEIGTTDVVAISVQSTNAKLAAAAATAYARAYIHVQQKEAVDSLNSAAQIVQTNVDANQVSINSVEGEISKIGNQAGQATSLETQLSTLEEQQSELRAELQNYNSAATLDTGGGQVVNVAPVPTSQVKPKTIEYAFLAGLLGLALGVGLAMILEYFDDDIRTREDLEKVTSSLPTLGLIPEIVDWRDKHAQYLVSASSPKSIPAEAYRSLRTSIQFLGLDHSIKTVQFTSPSAAEGKTTTMANLAVVMAQAGLRVVVVCCDLRRPRLHEFFNVSNQVGFTSVLLGETELADALQSVPGLDNLRILASGRIPPNPSELLSGNRTGEILATLAERADVVLIDSPPVLPVTDATVLASRVDAVVIVTSPRTSTRTQIARSLETLSRVDAPVAGVVLNRASVADSESYYQYVYGVPVQTERKGADTAV